jgi:Ca-activated chloride channel family protein
MVYGRPANVRSHRRGGARRRPKVAPWIVISLAVVLVASGLTVGYLTLLRDGCSGTAKATVVASPATATLLDELARGWVEAKPAVNGKCAEVEIEAKDSTVMAQALGTDWDEKSGGTPPDVWVPESTAWVRRASTAAIAERMMPDLQPSLARTPTVLAMPKPMAEAIGWPETPLTWQDVLNKFAASEGWQKYGKDWGPFRFGMTDPLKSTPGLLSLMAILDGNDDGEVSVDEQTAALRLKQVRAVYTDSTDQIFSELGKADGQGADVALRYVSAFPALEQDVLTYNQNSRKVPLVAVYPANGSADADHPYLVLNAPWSTKERQDVAKSFLDYVRGAEGRKAFLDDGFRDPNRQPGKGLTDVNGFAAKLTTLPRAVLLADSVKQTLDTWTALTRPTNLLLVLDVSGSMEEAVAGTGKNRLQLAKEAAAGAVKLLTDDTHAGLWVFSTKQDGTKDYRVVVPIGRLSEPVAGKSRKDAMLLGIDRLTPRGGTGLYDTLAAAQQAVIDSYKAGYTKMVVLMTDGRNEDDPGGLSLDQLRQRFTETGADANRKVPVVTVGYGEDADIEVLKEVSRLTGAQSYNARSSFDINQVLLTAIFGRV